MAGSNKITIEFDVSDPSIDGPRLAELLEDLLHGDEDQAEDAGQELETAVTDITYRKD
jgi:hypothetical protein